MNNAPLIIARRATVLRKKKTEITRTTLVGTQGQQTALEPHLPGFQKENNRNQLAAVKVALPVGASAESGA